MNAPQVDEGARPSGSVEADARMAAQGHPSWPNAPSPVERLASWIQQHPSLRRRLRRAKVCAISASSRMMGVALALVALVGLAGIGLSAARGVPLDQGDVLATCIVVALWFGNRTLRARWAARGLYEAPAPRRWPARLLLRRTEAPRLARVRRR